MGAKDVKYARAIIKSNKNITDVIKIDLIIKQIGGWLVSSIL